MNAAPGLLYLGAGDTVAIALRDLEAGEQLQVAGTALVLTEPVGSGHKVAVRVVPKGAPIVKYGVSIGTATTAIAPGEHVHTHNLESGRMRGDQQ
jgi:predicted homoserine dehydrogenase-like protein